MRAALAKLLGRGQPDVAAVSDALPPEVTIALGGASFLDRGQDENGNRRLMVMPAGGGSAFIYERAAARQYLADRFNLSDAQLTSALTLLRGCLADFDRKQAATIVPRRSAWTSWKPLRNFSEH